MGEILKWIDGGVLVVSDAWAERWRELVALMESESNAEDVGTSEGGAPRGLGSVPE